MLRPCRLTAALINPPPKGLGGYDLEGCAAVLKKEGYEIKSLTPRILIVKKGVETSIYPSGKILIKTKNEKLAREECIRLRALL